LAAFAYGHVEARFIQVDQLDLCSPKLASGVDHLRVVQVSDLHFSAVNGTALAGRVAEHIQALRPDLIVATGDMVDRGMRDPEAIARILRGMEARLGKFAVTGNHEFYHDLDESLRFLKRSGFRVLRGEAARPAPWLTLMGVDDEAAYRFSGPEGKSVEALLEDAPEEDLVILLRHRPLIDERAGGRIDLQLSGHTHGGQIFPFSLVVAQVFPFLKGTHTLDGGTVLHVNRGTGTWGPPVRFLSPPEITAIDIRRP
jgi:predicted MPP superfamily phosphohydrolase